MILLPARSDRHAQAPAGTPEQVLTGARRHRRARGERLCAEATHRIDEADRLPPLRVQLTGRRSVACTPHHPLAQTDHPTSPSNQPVRTLHAPRSDQASFVTTRATADCKRQRSAHTRAAARTEIRSRSAEPMCDSGAASPTRSHLRARACVRACLCVRAPVCMHACVRARACVRVRARAGVRARVRADSTVYPTAT